MPAPFLLVQLTDPHVGATWGEHDAAARLAAAVDSVLALPDRPDAVLVSGDVADHGDVREYETARDLLARLDAPVYVLPGNHDDRAALRHVFRLPGDDGAPVQYAADLGPLRLVAVDSTRPGEDRGELDSDRLAWLEAELVAGTDRPTIVALHHPPLRMGNRAWDAIGLPAGDQRSLGELLERHPHVQSVVGGHMHRAITAALGGRVVLAAPSTYGQAKLDFGAEEIELVPEPGGFVVHALVEGRLVSHVQPVDTA